MDSLDTDDQLTIVNRAQEYRISKKLICKIPYFEKMLSHECFESKENKVELDFDKQTFEIVLNWIRSNYSFILIEMQYVMDLYELADYFGLDWICKECIAHFKENFSIAHLPFVIPKVTATSKCINSGALNAFICRYFLKIANTTFWSKYPIETIEYICALDLMVHSEYQVFDAIMNWINFKADSRKCHLEGLLKLVRWCHLNEQDLSKIKEDKSFKSSGFEPIFCAPQKVNCDCTFNRTNQNYLVIIEKLDGRDLLIKVFDNNFTQLLSHAIKYDHSISSNIFHDEHVSDILFESGTGSLRIDWKLNKYVCCYDSFNELLKRIYGNSEQGTHLNTYFWNTENIEDGFKLLEGAENFILIYLKERNLHYFSRPTYENYKLFSHLNQCKATTLNNKIYLLTNKRMLYEFEIEYFNKFKETWSQRLCEDGFFFDSTLLTSSLAGDKIMVIDTNTANYICFDINTKASSKGRMATDSSRRKLVAFIPTFLPLNTIRTCLNSNRNSEN